MCVCVCVLAAQSCPTFCNSMDYIVHQVPLSLGFSSQEYWSSGHSLLQGSSRPRDGTWVSCIPGRFFTVRATREVPYYQPSFSSVQFSSGQVSCSVVSDSLQPRKLQHARPPCPSPTPGVYSNSCPSSQ